MATKKPLTVPYDELDEIVHTEEYPFCSREDCPCHNLLDNAEVYDQQIGRPLVDGLLTSEEAYRILWDRHI